MKIKFIQKIIDKIRGKNSTEKEILKHLKYIETKLSLKDDIFRFNNTKVYVPNYPIDWIQQQIVNNNNYYEEKILKELDNYIPNNATILDCGANIGNHTLYWLISSSKNIKRVYCFEPIRTTFDILTKNIEINNLKDKTILYNIGLFDVSTKGDIAGYSIDNIGGTQLKQGDGDIKLTCLDKIDYQSDTIDFIKIDVEGLEYNLLCGAKELLKKYKPMIFIEIFPENYKIVNEYLANKGYAIMKKYSNNYLYKHSDK